MREKGVVDRVEDGFAVVRLARTDACSHCGACQRVVPGSNELEIRVRNNLDAAPGDMVELELEPGDVLRAAAIVYGLPLLAGMAGFIAGSAFAGGAYRVALAAAGFALSFPVVHILDRRAAREARFQPSMTAVDRRGSAPEA